MGRPASQRKCQACGEPGLKRNGTRNGRTRWRCTKCGASISRTRTDQQELSQLQQFLSWVTGTHTQSRIDGTLTGRTFRQDTAWCWNIPVPKPEVTGVVHEQVFLDGTYLAYNWCLLIARSGSGQVLGWQWAASENSPAYKQLLNTIPAPLVVTTDGNGGALKAIHECWPDSEIQRCLLHVHRNNIRDLTRNPKTMAGKALLGLSKGLLTVTSKDEAASWAALLGAFHTEYSSYLKERTYAKDDPIGAAARGKKPTGWWYTHGRDRRVYQRLNRLYQRGELFTYLTTPDTPLERTTNPVESINHQVKQVIKHHPGLSEDHLICAIEWVLHQYTENPANPKEILKTWRNNGKPTRRLFPKKRKQPQHLGPKQYDTGLSSEEGLWTRKGWAGRSHPH